MEKKIMCFTILTASIYLIYDLFSPDLSSVVPLPPINSINPLHNPSDGPAQNVLSGENFHWIDPPGDLRERVAEFNNEITTFRKRIMERRGGNSTWKDVDRNLSVLWCAQDKFMSLLTKYKQVQTILLKWRNAENEPANTLSSSNIIVKEYHPWTASGNLCSRIQTQGRTRAHYDVVYNRTCTSNMSQGFLNKTMEPFYFHAKPVNKKHYWPNGGLSYPSYYFEKYPDYVLFIHILQDAVILPRGFVISGNLKLLPHTCGGPDFNKKTPKGHYTSSLHNEIFVISQFWGTGFFHKNVECIPRIAPYLTFLKENPDIFIHVAETGGYTKETLQILGVEPHRLVTGLVRAKVVYLPQGTPCGFGNIHLLQLLSRLYAEHITHHLLNSSSNHNRTTVVYIRRSRRRQFLNNKAVENVVAKAASDFKLPFEVFRDNPAPGLKAAMILFHKAVLVVGPHGAGLSNIVYSVPGTYVIEGVCNPPHVNMCYQRLAHVLGHRYHGIAAQHPRCEGRVDVEPGLIDTAVRIYLRHITQS